MRSMVLLLGLGFVCSWPTAQAGPGGPERGPRGRGGMPFHRLDENGDGEATLDEFRAAHEQRLNRMFEKIDLDRDGVLTEDEYENAMQEWRDKKRERKQRRERQSEE